jgi:putative DNA primase/helicase
MQPQVQILGLRSFFSKEKQKEIVFDAFFEKNWRAPSVADIFARIDHYLAQIPEAERWNLYYTTATCLEEKGRKMVEQAVMPFDVDKLDIERLDEYVPVVLAAIGVERETTGIVYSGNGLQFIVGLNKPFTSPDYFDLNRLHYKAIVERINRALAAVGLPGEGDPTVFSPARLMRLPNTLNRKKDKAERQGRLLQGRIVPVDFDITIASGLPKVEASDHINPQALKRYATPDTPTILKECRFLSACATDPGNVSEAEWYAMLSITARLANGNQLSHDMSNGHPGYSHSETEAKIEQALQASGPRTCSNINKTWGKCHTCPHFEKVNSPIMLRGANYIKTQDTGFHDVVIDAKGNPRPGKPNHEDLRKFFEQQNSYRTLGSSRIVFTWNGKYWREMPDAYIENFAQAHFNPVASTAMVQEFKNLVCRTNLTDPSWFIETTNRRINFANGVLDLGTMELRPHSSEFGFRYVLPYDYDPKATAPRFEKFLREIMCDREDLVHVLMEYAGYCFSNDTCWTQKALIMTGEGANGKSTLMSVLRGLAGKENYASLGLADLKAETNRQQLDGRLFNLAEETPTYAMSESSLFKNLVSGGETTVKMLYKQPYTIANKCKLMFACNELPKTKDTTKGFFRRLLIVPFDRVFEGQDRDDFLEEKLIAELPGIFNLVIAGYHRLKQTRRFTEAKAIDLEIKKYRLEVDTVHAWYRDNVDHSAGESFQALVSKMYGAYKFFTEERGEKPETLISFARRLSKLVPDYEKRQTRKVIDGRKESLLKGVRFGELRDF